MFPIVNAVAWQELLPIRNCDTCYHTIFKAAAQRLVLQARPQAAQHPRGGWGFNAGPSTMADTNGSPIAIITNFSAPHLPRRLCVNKTAPHATLPIAQCAQSPPHMRACCTELWRAFLATQSPRGAEEYRRNSRKDRRCLATPTRSVFPIGNAVAWQELLPIRNCDTCYHTIFKAAAQRLVLQARPQAAQHPRGGWGFNAGPSTMADTNGSPIAIITNFSAPHLPRRLCVNKTAPHATLPIAQCAQSPPHMRACCTELWRAFLATQSPRGAEEYRRNSRKDRRCLATPKRGNVSKWQCDPRGRASCQYSYPPRLIFLGASATRKPVRNPRCPAVCTSRHSLPPAAGPHRYQAWSLFPVH